VKGGILIYISINLDLSIVQPIQQHLQTTTPSKPLDTTTTTKITMKFTMILFFAIGALAAASPQNANCGRTGQPSCEGGGHETKPGENCVPGSSNRNCAKKAEDNPV
jgi:hypothetical protein